MNNPTEQEECDVETQTMQQLKQINKMKEAMMTELSEKRAYLRSIESNATILESKHRQLELQLEELNRRREQAQIKIEQANYQQAMETALREARHGQIQSLMRENQLNAERLKIEEQETIKIENEMAQKASKSQRELDTVLEYFHRHPKRTQILQIEKKLATQDDVLNRIREQIQQLQADDFRLACEITRRRTDSHNLAFIPVMTEFSANMLNAIKLYDQNVKTHHEIEIELKAKKSAMDERRKMLENRHSESARIQSLLNNPAIGIALPMGRRESHENNQPPSTYFAMLNRVMTSNTPQSSPYFLKPMKQTPAVNNVTISNETTPDTMIDRSLTQIAPTTSATIVTQSKTTPVTRSHVTFAPTTITIPQTPINSETSSSDSSPLSVTEINAPQKSPPLPPNISQQENTTIISSQKIRPLSQNSKKKIAPLPVKPISAAAASSPIEVINVDTTPEITITNSNASQASSLVASGEQKSFTSDITSIIEKTKQNLPPTPPFVFAKHEMFNQKLTASPPIVPTHQSPFFRPHQQQHPNSFTVQAQTSAHDLTTAPPTLTDQTMPMDQSTTHEPASQSQPLQCTSSSVGMPSISQQQQPILQTETTINNNNEMEENNTNVVNPDNYPIHDNPQTPMMMDMTLIGGGGYLGGDADQSFISDGNNNLEANLFMRFDDDPPTPAGSTAGNGTGNVPFNPFGEPVDADQNGGGGQDGGTTSNPTFSFRFGGDSSATNNNDNDQQSSANKFGGFCFF